MSGTLPCMHRSWTGQAGLAAALLLGLAFRLGWGADIEYKADEDYMFRRSREVGRTEAWPALGMTSGVGLRNPGLSVWIFVVLGRMSGAHDPPGLAHAVGALNIVAILLVVAFAIGGVAPEEREAWLWAAALASVNPLAVLFHRKIWAQSVLPLFSIATLYCWRKRDRRWGAFAWGLLGALLGQIHMSGFFFAAAFALWALLFDRRGVRWGSWLAGSALGALSLAPWLVFVAGQLAERRPGGPWPEHRPWLEFWGLWAEDALGLGMAYSLNRDFLNFLRYPLVGGWPTYGVFVLHLVLAVAGAVILARAGLQLWQKRGGWYPLWVGRGSPTAFIQAAVLWGFGILLTASTLPIYRHYLIVTFPLEFVWLARLALASRRETPRLGRLLLITICLAQALVSAYFLSYIHVNGGAIHGDYGASYGSQLPHGPPTGG